MVEDIKLSVVTILSQIRKQEKVERKSTVKITNQGLRDSLEEKKNINIENNKPVNTPIINQDQKVGRNDPCPCGSARNIKIVVENSLLKGIDKMQFCEMSSKFIL
jgi:preprotein translocase subunit SecA